MPHKQELAAVSFGNKSAAEDAASNMRSLGWTCEVTEGIDNQWRTIWTVKAHKGPTPPKGPGRRPK